MRSDFPLPNVDWPLTAGYWAAAARRELAIPHCASCARWVWYPAARCPSCGGDDMPWTVTSGKGRLYSWSIVRHVFLPAFASKVPYAVGLVALDEDPAVRVAGPLLGDHERLTAGMPVAVEFRPLRFDGVPGEVLAPHFGPGG
jgi:hypothetical protein